MIPFPSLTKNWHSKAYAAIDPTRPELSAKGKVVVVTGGGGSIGGATALAYARAGADKIALIGRREGPLSETKKTIEAQVPHAKVLALKGDLSDATSMQSALEIVSKELGQVNIFLANAGYLSRLEYVSTAEPEEWWTGFVSVR